MQPKSRPTPSTSGPARPRPGQDIILTKAQAKQFPGVGMTLPTYKQGSAAQRARLQPKTRPPKVRLYKRIFTRSHIKKTFISLIVAGLLVGGFVGAKFIYNAHKLFGGSLFSILDSTKLKGESTGRVNILLAGNSADDPGHQGANLTDSIMIISIDTRNNTAFLLSVPRDLWVNIPGGGYQKINAAYVVGQNDNFNQPGYPSGGMGLLEQVVSQDFGIPIDYYALVNYAALKGAVNAVGGINFVVNSQDPRGLYDPSIDYATGGPLVNLTNGPHVLNGEQALDLARARGDAYGSYGFDSSDFQRTADQRQMIVDIKNKAETAGVLANPAKLTSLFDAIGSNVKTDFTLSDVHRLFDLVKPIGSKNTQSLSLESANGMSLVKDYETEDGESALIPADGLGDYDSIQAFVRQQTSSNPVVREDANVVVLNATNSDGVAAQEQTALSVDNINVTTIGDASSPQASSTIIDNSLGKKPATRALLVKLFGNNVTTVNPYSDLYKADFIVLVGENQAASAGNTN